MLTDSGGYQVFSLAKTRTISEDGVRFRSHIDGRAFDLTPEESMRIQRFLGADMIMAFDECPPIDASKEAVSDAVARTTRWMARCIEAWQKPGWPNGAETQSLYGIVQGGLHQDLREQSLAEITNFDLPAFALGGLSVGESFTDRNLVLDWVADKMPHNKVRYLMGVGTPLDLVEAVYRGIDQFDCVLPTRMGRHGIAYTDQGPLHLKRAQYTTDQRPLDEHTQSAASRVSRGYIRHMLKANEALGGILLGIHNIAYYQRLMKRMREAIIAGTFETFVSTFRCNYNHDGADKAQEA